MFFEMTKTGTRNLCSNFDRILSQVFVFNLLYFGFRCIMKWSEFSDTLLVREILVIEPYQFIPKSKERGQTWAEVARNVTKALGTGYVVSQKLTRYRFNLLCEKHKAKQRDELRPQEYHLKLLS